jgi:MFS family permease
MLLVSALAIVGGTLVLAIVRDGPHVAATAPFDPHAIRRVLASRGARLATLGYLGHMWELYAMWTWVAVFAAASFAASGMSDPSAAGSVAAFLAIGSGAIGCVAAGYIADRVGKARVAMWAMLASAAAAALTLVVFGRSPMLLYALIMFWGLAVVADSAQFSALVSEHAPRDHVGTALTLQTCVGFLLTMVTIEALPRVAAASSWQFASLLLVPGPLLGAWAMYRLRR